MSQNDKGEGARLLEKLGFKPGHIVQEFCWDDDVNQDLRAELEAHLGEELVDEDFKEVADGVLIWWRTDDGDVDDLTDLLVECVSNLDRGGRIWVFTPKAGRAGNVAANDIEEAASNVGLLTTSAIVAGQWSGIKIEVHARRG